MVETMNINRASVEASSTGLWSVVLLRTPPVSQPQMFPRLSKVNAQNLCILDQTQRSSLRCFLLLAFLHISHLKRSTSSRRSWVNQSLKHFSLLLPFFSLLWETSWIVSEPGKKSLLGFSHRVCYTCFHKVLRRVSSTMSNDILQLTCMCWCDRWDVFINSMENWL